MLFIIFVLIIRREPFHIDKGSILTCKEEIKMNIIFHIAIPLEAVMLMQGFGKQISEKRVNLIHKTFL